MAQYESQVQLGSIRERIEIAPPLLKMASHFSQKDFLRRSIANIQRVKLTANQANNNNDANVDQRFDLKRVEHVCTVPPSVAVRANPSWKRDATDLEAFHFHGDRFRMCFFADDERKHMYSAVYFSDRAEGPPRNVHGGAIAAVADIAVVTLASHNSDRVCLTKSLSVVYEKTIPLGSEVIIRSWLYKIEGNKLEVHYDIVSPKDFTRHSRGSAVLVVYPKSRAAGSSLDDITTALVESKLLKAREEEEDELELRPRPAAVLQVLKFPEAHPLMARYKNWEPMDHCAEFPDIVNPVTRGFIGMHNGTHFDFIDNGGTMLWKLFRSQEKKVEGLVFFSKHTEGPPRSVHGGAIAAAMDSLFGDTVFFLNGWGNLTKMLSIEYKASIPPNSMVIFKDVELIRNRDRRGVHIRGKLTDENGKVYCEGIASFVPAGRDTFSLESMRDQFGRTSNKTSEENKRDFLAYAAAGNGKL